MDALFTIASGDVLGLTAYIGSTITSLIPVIAFCVGLPLGVYVVRKATHIL